MKLLIFSPDSYSVFHTDTKYIFGGAEIETGYHAHGLAALGVDVSVITRDHAIPVHKFGNVKLYPDPELKGTGYWNNRKTLRGRIGFRIFGDRNPHQSREQLLKEIDPDVVYIMGMSPEAHRLSAYAVKENKKFIFRVAHDLDLVGNELDEQKVKKWAGISFREVKEVIGRANVVLTQSQVQDELLKKWFDRKGELMFPPIDVSVPDQKNEKKYDLLWIGKNNVFKRPEKLVELAKRLPEKKICMIFNKVEETSWNRIVETITENVTLIESVPADQVENTFRQSRVFVSTSLHEGFANTFLQAAKNNVPVISMGPDPNQMLSVHRAGMVAGDDMDKLTAIAEKMLGDADYYQEFSEASRRYIVNFHRKEKISEQFHEVLVSLG